MRVPDRPLPPWHPGRVTSPAVRRRRLEFGVGLVVLLVLPDAGHVAQMEDPESVARAFLGMLEEQGSPVR